MKSHTAIPLLLIAAAAVISYYNFRAPAKSHEAGMKQTNPMHPSSQGFREAAATSVHRTTKRTRQTAILATDSDDGASWSEMDPVRKERLVKRMSDWNSID
ncbi:MAG: hypothetical protein V4819_02750 [Verrucomicrobiota bacterium]